MILRARVSITIKSDILDPAGEAIKRSLAQLKLLNVREVRIGKIVDLIFDDDKELSQQLLAVEAAAKQLLSNPIMEDVAIEILSEADKDV